MIDDTVYTGWADSSTVGSFRARSFDGTNFGPSTTLELYANGLTTDSRGFGVDIPRITGMFYDRPTGRLYYTLKPNASNNSGGFFYRYFTPESGVVGAQRFTALNGSLMGANSNGTTYPRGMFRDGGKVYFVDSTGALKSIDFVSGDLRFGRRGDRISDDGQQRRRLAGQRLVRLDARDDGRSQHRPDRRPDRSVRRPRLHLRRIAKAATPTARWPATRSTSATGRPRSRPAGSLSTPTAPATPTPLRSR